jgi:phage-related protein
MENYIILNDIDGRTIGVKCGQFPAIVIPKKRMTSIVIEGRDGSLTETDNCYDSYLWAFECYMDDDNLEQVATWLHSGSVVKTLRRSDNLEKVYYVKVTNQIDLDQIVLWRNFTIIFEVQPFNESYTEYEEVITQDGEFTIGGTMSAYPTFEIIGTGDIAITINNKTFSVIGIDGTVVADGKLKVAIQDETANIKTSGNYPLLNAGTNNISILGNYTSFKIKYRRTNLC